MTVSNTLRFLLKKYSSGGDPHPSRVEFNLMIDAIENNAGMFSQGTTAERPAAGKPGRWYWDETVSRMYYDDGVAWQDQNPNGGGGAGAAIVPGAAAAEGVAVKSARADHTHTLALATAAVDGAMPKADKAKLDAATDAATASAVMRRDASSRVSVGTPTLTGHATTKAYVDGAVTAIGDAAADYTDGAVAAAPNATGTTAGKMSAGDKAKLDAATVAATVSTIVMRDANGAINIQAQSLAGHAARKDYVDGKTWDGADIATGTVAAARLPVATGSVPGTMSATDKAKLDAASTLPTPNTLMFRSSAGTVHVETGTGSTDAANKAYVDDATGKGGGWVTSGLTIPMQAGWTLNSYRVRVKGGTVWYHLNVTYTGADFATDANGALSDKAVCTMPVGYRPVGINWPVECREWSARTWGGHADAAGTVAIGYGMPSRTVTAGTVFYFYGIISTD